MTLAKEDKDQIINFVSRTSHNQGVVARVKILPNKKTLRRRVNYCAVRLGISLVIVREAMPILYCTHIKVLEPKRAMNLQEKIYYCICIAKKQVQVYLPW
jgi:hypothetical protein